jgi:hypothetical protein
LRTDAKGTDMSNALDIRSPFVGHKTPATGQITEP